MRNIILKRIIMIAIALAVVTPVTSVDAMLVLSKRETTKYINTIASRQMNVVKNPSHNSAGGEWTVMGLARAGKITSNYKTIYKNNLTRELNRKKGILSKTAYTEYSRTVIALTSIGENPYNFNGYDVISPLAEFDNVIKQGLNGVAYALIALNSGNYEVKPKSGYEGKIGGAERYKSVLISSELAKGGWALFNKKPDVDMTAIAIQALSPYYNKETKATKAINDGLKVLSEKQKSDGGFESMGNENCESSSQVLTAISSLRISIKDKRFVKNKKTVLDGLMKYYDNGAFKHTTDGLENQMATDQAFYALVSFRNTLANDPPIFNMKEVAVKKKYRKPATVKKNKKTKKKNINTKKNDNNINKQAISKESKNNKDKNEKITSTIYPTTVNIVKETTVSKKNKEEKGNTRWWIGLIIALIISPGLAYLVFRKQRGKDV